MFSILFHLFVNKKFFHTRKTPFLTSEKGDKAAQFREAPLKQGGCLNGILPDSVSTPPQANVGFMGTITVVTHFYTLLF